MTMFRRSGAMCVAQFSRQEAQVLRQCVAELAALLSDHPAPDDPAADLPVSRSDAAAAPGPGCGTSKVELVRSIGAEDVIDYTRHEIDRDGTRYDIIIDTAGNRPLSLLRRATTPQGTIALVGGGHAKGRIMGGFQRQLAAPLLSPFMSQGLCGVAARERYEDLEELTQAIESGSVTPVIDRIYALADVPDAIRYLAQGHPAGKVVVTV